MSEAANARLAMLGIGRDVAVVLLSVECLLVGIVPLYVLLQVTRLLRRLTPRLRDLIRRGHSEIERITQFVDRVARAVQAPFLRARRLGMSVSRYYGRLFSRNNQGGLL